LVNTNSQFRFTALSILKPQVHSNVYYNYYIIKEMQHVLSNDLSQVPQRNYCHLLHLSSEHYSAAVIQVCGNMKGLFTLN